MGVVARMPEPLGEALHFVVRRRVLASIGLVVPKGLVQSRLIGEVPLPEPVDSNHAERLPPAGRRQFEATARRGDESGRLQSLRQLRRTLSREPQHARQTLQRRMNRRLLSA